MADAPLPEPLVPAHVDLNGYEFMPLYGERLRRSEFNKAHPEAKWAGLMLWWASWWERPAASLPNNDRDLAALAGCKDLRAWRRVNACAMRGWVLCADNRWYHPILADLACDAFAKRKSQSVKGRAGAQKRWGINGHSDASANATAKHADSRGNASATQSDSRGNSTGNSNRSEGSSNKQLPVPIGTPTAQPPRTPVEEPPRSTPPLAPTFPAEGVAAFAKSHGVKVRKPQPASFDEP